MEFVLDTVIKYPDTGWILPDRFADWAQGTNHMDKKDPDGANIGFLDGHQEWRHFENMYQRYTIQGVFFLVVDIESAVVYSRFFIDNYKRQIPGLPNALLSFLP